jgi:hypothetical protein
MEGVSLSGWLGYVRGGVVGDVVVLLVMVR